jgi:signal transduction histidine kinase
MDNEKDDSSDLLFVHIEQSDSQSLAIIPPEAHESEWKVSNEQYRAYMSALLHDLKSPLTGTNRVLNMIIDGRMGPLSKQHGRLLGQIVTSNAQLLYLIENAIEVDRLERKANEFTLDNVDLVESLSNSVNDYQADAESRGIRLAADLPKGPLWVLANALALRRLWQNLIDNAIKFAAPMGFLNIELESNGEEVTVHFKDNGPGISEGDQKLIFDRFKQGRTGKTSASGSGLGLFICREIVEAHGGKIELKSKEGLGTTFSITLPKARKH